MFCGDGHLGFFINPKNVNCVDDHIWNKNPAKFSVKISVILMKTKMSKANGWQTQNDGNILCGFGSCEIKS